MENNFGEKIAAELQDFAERLRSDEPIKVTRVRWCETCDGDDPDCFRCGGDGCIREDAWI